MRPVGDVPAYWPTAVHTVALTQLTATRSWDGDMVEALLGNGGLEAVHTPPAKRSVSAVDPFETL